MNNIEIIKYLNYNIKMLYFPAPSEAPQNFFIFFFKFQNYLVNLKKNL